MKAYKHSDLRGYITANLDYSRPKLEPTKELEKYYMDDKQDTSPVCTLTGPNVKTKTTGILQAINSRGTEKTALIVCENGDNVEIFQAILKHVFNSQSVNCKDDIKYLFIDQADYIDDFAHACVDLKQLSDSGVKVIIACHTTMADSLVTRLGVIADVRYKEEFKCPEKNKKPGKPLPKPVLNPEKDIDDEPIDIAKSYDVLVPTPERLVDFKQRVLSTFETYADHKFVSAYALPALWEIMVTLPELCDTNPQKYASKIKDLAYELATNNATILDMDPLTAAIKIAIKRFDKDAHGPANAKIHVFPCLKDAVLIIKGEWLKEFMAEETTQEYPIAHLRKDYGLLSYSDAPLENEKDEDTKIRRMTWKRAVENKTIRDDAITLDICDTKYLIRHLDEIAHFGKYDNDHERGPRNRPILDNIIISAAAEYSSKNRVPDHAKANAFIEYAKETGLYSDDMGWPSETMQSLQAEFTARCDIPGSRANVIYEAHKSKSKNYVLDFTKPEVEEMMFVKIKDLPGMHPLYRN